MLFCFGDVLALCWVLPDWMLFSKASAPSCIETFVFFVAFQRPLSRGSLLWNLFTLAKCLLKISAFFCYSWFLLACQWVVVGWILLFPLLGCAEDSIVCVHLWSNQAVHNYLSMLLFLKTLLAVSLLYSFLLDMQECFSAFFLAFLRSFKALPISMVQ